MLGLERGVALGQRFVLGCCFVTEELKMFVFGVLGILIAT